MKSDWYCLDCDTSIDREEIDRHEDDGHRVRGKLRPDRLLSNDPWQVGDDAPAGERSGTGDGSTGGVGPTGDGTDKGGDR